MNYGFYQHVANMEVYLHLFSWTFLKLSTYHLKPSKGFSRVVKWTELKMWDQRKDRKLIILSKQANNIHTDKENVRYFLKYLNMKNILLTLYRNICCRDFGRKSSIGNPELSNFPLRIQYSIKHWKISH